MNSSILSQVITSCLTKTDLANSLADHLKGRSIGDTYVVNVERRGPDLILLETADGCKFKVTCEGT